VRFGNFAWVGLGLASYEWRHLEHCTRASVAGLVGGIKLDLEEAP